MQKYLFLVSVLFMLGCGEKQPLSTKEPEPQKKTSRQTEPTISDAEKTLFVAKKYEALSALQSKLPDTQFVQVKFIFLLGDDKNEIYKQYVVRKPNLSVIDFNFIKDSISHDNDDGSWRRAFANGTPSRWEIWAIDSKGIIHSLFAHESASFAKASNYGGTIAREKFEEFAANFFKTINKPYVQQLDENGNFIE